MRKMLKPARCHMSRNRTDTETCATCLDARRAYDGTPSPGRSDPQLSLMLSIDSRHSCCQIRHWLTINDGLNIIFIYVSCSLQMVSCDFLEDPGK